MSSVSFQVIGADAAAGRADSAVNLQRDDMTSMDGLPDMILCLCNGRGVAMSASE